MNLRNIQDCSPEVLQSLALLAVHPEAFGPSQFWNSNEVYIYMIFYSYYLICKCLFKININIFR